MSGLLILVEGETEETFVGQVLAPHLHAAGMHSVGARLMGNARLRARRGGIRGWPSTLRDIERHLREDQGVYISTMVDYYGLPERGRGEWPGRARAASMAHEQKALCVESAMSQDVAAAVPELSPHRFIPFVTMHEFEGLLFSDCASFARAIGEAALQSQFEAIRAAFSNPEQINDAPTTHPSRRVANLVHGYEKVLLGTIAALEIGLQKIMIECPHFADWVGRLESLAT